MNKPGECGSANILPGLACTGDTRQEEIADWLKGVRLA